MEIPDTIVILTILAFLAYEIIGNIHENKELLKG